MVKRLIIHIDEEKCDGCGLCVPSCAEGALEVVNGKVRLVEDRLCDGLGACVGHCPRGALWVEEREALAFDEVAVEQRLRRLGHVDEPIHAQNETVPAGCPGSRMLAFSDSGLPDHVLEASPSALRQWPVQLTLVPVRAPYFKHADLLVAADCVPFACGSFHRDLLKGKALVVGCPKLDDARRYIEKLAAIISENDLKGITVAHMEVPCCFGLRYIVEEALDRAGRDVPLRDVTVSVRGELVLENPITTKTTR